MTESQHVDTHNHTQNSPKSDFFLGFFISLRKEYRPQTHSITQHLRSQHIQSTKTQVMWRYHWIHWLQLAASYQVKKKGERAEAKGICKEGCRSAHCCMSGPHAHTHTHKWKLCELLQVRLMLIIKIPSTTQWSILDWLQDWQIEEKKNKCTQRWYTVG